MLASALIRRELIYVFFYKKSQEAYPINGAVLVLIKLSIKFKLVKSFINSFIKLY